MKLFAMVALALALALAMGSAHAQTSTDGTASGSTAPNQLGTGLNNATNGDSLGRSAPGSGTTLPETTVGVGDTSTNGTTALPGAGGTAATYGTGSTQFTNPAFFGSSPFILTPTGAVPATSGSVPGFALPIPQQQQQQQQGAQPGTTSGMTSGPSSTSGPWMVSPTPTSTP